MDYARAIRTARAARGLTQQELAKRAGVDASYVSLLERGSRTPRIDRLDQIAAALDLPLYLLVLLGTNQSDLRGVAEEDARELSYQLLGLLTSQEPEDLDR